MAEAERLRLEGMFHDLDANNDGRVDPKELAEGVKKMGYYHVTEEQIIVRYFILILHCRWKKHILFITFCNKNEFELQK